MSPPATKKRKTNGGGAAVVRVAAGTRRTTRSQKPLLGIELIGKMASFAQYGYDLMNICLTVGSKDSAVIRYACLRNNMEYLQRTLENYSNDPTTCGRDRCRSNVRSWMEVNPNWRKHCTLERTEDCDFRYPMIRDEEDNIVLRTGPLILFNNPAVAIEFGLVDVLSYLVEKIGIDINAYKWSGFEKGKSGLHLLLFAGLKSRNGCSECLKYILSRENANVNLGICDGTDPIWHNVMSEPDYFSIEIFEAIVRHPTFDPNQANFDAFPDAPLPLHQAIVQAFCASPGGSTHVSRAVERFEILLENGADPLLKVQDPDGDTRFSPRDHLLLVQDRKGLDPTIFRTCQKLVDIIRKHRLSKIKARSGFGMSVHG